MKTRTAVTGLASLLMAGSAQASDKISMQGKAEMQSDLTTISSPFSPLVVQRDKSGYNLGAALQFPVSKDLALTVEATKGTKTGLDTINGTTYGIENDRTTSFSGDLDYTIKGQIMLGLKGSYNATDRTWTFPLTAATDDLSLRGYSVDGHGVFAFPGRDLALALHVGGQSIGQDPRNLYDAIQRINLGGEVSKLLTVPLIRVPIVAKAGLERETETYQAENNTQSRTLDVDHNTATAGIDVLPISVSDLRSNPLALSGGVKGQYGFGRNGGYGAGATFAGQWNDLEVRADAEMANQRSHLQHTLNTRAPWKAGLTVTYRK